MKTMPNRLGKGYPRGTHRAMCDFCGSVFYRHNLVRKESGLLACKADCAKGRDEVQLSRMNAEHAAKVMKHPADTDGTNTDNHSLPTIVRRTAEDILRYTDDDV